MAGTPSRGRGASRAFYDDHYAAEASGAPAAPAPRASGLSPTREDVVYELLPQGGRLLELGCGAGGFLRRSMEKVDVAVGVDIARVRLHKRAGAREPEMACADVNAGLPFRDASFDAVALIAVLDHLADMEAVLVECRRVLKPGGRLLVQVPNVAFLPRRARFLLGHFPRTADTDKGWDGGKLHYLTKGSLQRLLARAGFRPVRVTGSGFLRPLRAWWPSLLTADLVVEATR